MSGKSPDNTAPLEPERALDVLGDATCREILRNTSSEPLTARELVEQCEESRSTVYRKLGKLTENGFLSPSNRIQTDAKNATQFEAAIDSVHVTFTERGGLTLECVPWNDGSD